MIYTQTLCLGANAAEFSGLGRYFMRRLSQHEDPQAVYSAPLPLSSQTQPGGAG